MSLSTRINAEEVCTSPSETAKSGNSSLDKIDANIMDLKTFIQDMISSTKIGNKWQFGIEQFLEDIELETSRVALASATVIAQYAEANANLKIAHTTVNNLNDRINLRPDLDSIESSKMSYAPNKMSTMAQNDNYGDTSNNDFPEKMSYAAKAKKQTTAEPNKQPNAEKARASKVNTVLKQIQTKRQARSKPVLPTFIVKGTEDSPPIQSDVWKAVSSANKRPRINICRWLKN